MVRVDSRPQGLKGKDGVSDREGRSPSFVFKRAAAVAALVLATLAPASAKGQTMVGGLLLQPRTTAVDSEQTARNSVNDYFQNGFAHDRMSETGIVSLRQQIGQGQQVFSRSQALMEFALGLFTLSERAQGLTTPTTATQARGLQNIYAQLNEGERRALRDFATRYAQMTPVERITQLGNNPSYTRLTQLIETQVYGRSSPTGMLTIGSNNDDLSTVNTAVTQIRAAALPPSRATMFAFGGDAGTAQAPQPTVAQPPVVAAPQVNQTRIDARNHAIEDLEALEREIQGYQAIDASVGSRSLTRVQQLLQRLREDRTQDPNGTRQINQDQDPLYAATQALLPASSLRQQVGEARVASERRQTATQRAEADRVRREEAARVAAQRAQQQRDAQAQAQAQRLQAQQDAQRTAQEQRQAAVTERTQTRDAAVSTLDAFIRDVNGSSLVQAEKTRLVNTATALRRQVAALNPNNAFTNAQQALIANANNSGAQSTTGLRGQFNTAVTQAAQVSAPATTVAFTAAQRRTFVLEELQMLAGASSVSGMNRTQLTAMKREAARLRAAILRPRSTEAQVTSAEQFLQNNFVAYRAVVFQRRLSRAARENMLEVGREARARTSGRAAVTAIAPSAQVAAVRDLVNGLQGENLVDRARLAVRSLYLGSNLTTDQRVVAVGASEISGPMREMQDAIRNGNVEEAARVYRAEQDNSRARLAQVREALRAERARLRALIPSGVRVRETNGRMAAVTLGRGQTTPIPTDAQLRGARRNMGRGWANTTVFAQSPGLESVYNYLGTLDTRVAGYIETTRTSGPRTRRRTTTTPNEELSATAVLAAERNVTVALEGIGAAQNGFAYAQRNIPPTSITGRNTRTTPNPTHYRVFGASAIILREVVNPNWGVLFRPVARGTQIVGTEAITTNRTVATDPRGIRFAESIVRRNEAGIHGMQMLNGANYVVLPGSVDALAAEVVAATQTSTLTPADQEIRQKLANVSAARFVADQFERAFEHSASPRSQGDTDIQTSARIALLERVLAVAESAETTRTTQMIHLAQSWRAQNPGLTTAEVAQRARNLDAIIYSLPRIQELALRIETLPEIAPRRQEALQALTSAMAEFERTFGMRLTPNDTPVVRSDALRLSGQIAERALRNLDPEYWTITSPRTDITIVTTGGNIATLRERRRTTTYTGMSIPTQDTPLALADQREIIARNMTGTINGYGGFVGNPTATIPAFQQVVEAFATSRFVAAVAIDNRRGDGYYAGREANPEEVVNRGIGRIGIPTGRATLTEAEIERQRAELARGGTTAIVTQVLRPDPLTSEAVLATRNTQMNVPERNVVSIHDAEVVGGVLQNTMNGLGDIAAYSRAHRNDANVDMLIEPVRRALEETMPESRSWNEGQFRRYILSSLRVIGEAQDTLELYGRLIPEYHRAAAPITGGFELLPYELRQRCEQANLEIGRIPPVVIEQLRTLTTAPVATEAVAVNSSITISDPIYSQSGNRVSFEVRVNETRQYFQQNRVEVDAVAFVNIGSPGSNQIYIRDPGRPTNFVGMLMRNARLSNGERADVIVPVRETGGHFVADIGSGDVPANRVLMYVQRGQFTPDLSTDERTAAYNRNRDVLTYPGVVEGEDNKVTFEFPNSGDTRIGVVVNAQRRSQ